MSDIKLFRTKDGEVVELQGNSADVEKTLQRLIERHLEEFLGVRFLESEYSTGKTHSGRIDTLGIDENNSPVIIEYKRAADQNVINQGLFYLDWLLDHQAEFALLAMKKLRPEIQEEIDWSAPRLICMAGDFTNYDEHAVRQINRNIDLIRYQRYGEEFLVLELVNSTTAAPALSLLPDRQKSTAKTVAENLEQASDDLRALYERLESYLLALGDDVQRKELKFYFAFKRLRNFACVEVYPQSQKLSVHANVDPDSVGLVDGFSRDVRSIGHFGTGDLELTLQSEADFDRAKPLLEQSYAAS